MCHAGEGINNRIGELTDFGRELCHMSPGGNMFVVVTVQYCAADHVH